MIKQKIDQDLKAALLAGDKAKTEVLRGLKSAILYAEVAAKARATGLDEQSILAVISKESKKRTESADMYKQAGETDRAQTELSEKAIIDEYLPEQLNDEQLGQMVDATMSELSGEAQMGQIIGAVKQKVGSQADGSRIASLVKEKLG